MKCQILLSEKNKKKGKNKKIRFDLSCKLSPKETICMKCQILLSGKNKKNISKCYLNFLPSMLSIKQTGVLDQTVCRLMWAFSVHAPKTPFSNERVHMIK